MLYKYLIVLKYRSYYNNKDTVYFHNCSTCIHVLPLGCLIKGLYYCAYTHQICFNLDTLIATSPTVRFK